MVQTRKGTRIESLVRLGQEGAGNRGMDPINNPLNDTTSHTLEEQS